MFLGLNERSIVRLEYWEYLETTKSKVISQANGNTSWQSDLSVQACSEHQVWQNTCKEVIIIILIVFDIKIYSHISY